MVSLHCQTSEKEIKYRNMSVQELIEKLSNISNKDLEVCFPYSHGTDESGNPLRVIQVSEYDDCVVVH